MGSLNAFEFALVYILGYFHLANAALLYLTAEVVVTMAKYVVGRLK